MYLTKNNGNFQYYEIIKCLLQFYYHAVLFQVFNRKCFFNCYFVRVSETITLFSAFYHFETYIRIYFVKPYKNLFLY